MTRREDIDMRSDLLELNITLEQVQEISGLSDRDLQNYEATKSHRTIFLVLSSRLTAVCLRRGEVKEITEILSWFNSRQILRNILDKVYSYIKLIRAIDINDQLEAAGNPTLNLSDRHQVIEAISSAQEDLLRALKTERILRDNKEFIANNPHMFVSNLTALPTLQVSEQASEYGRLLDETLQIAVGVRQEINKLQG
ncbi:hypothetical protein IQ235_08645 [Oscillatoriales cyanobacterium LEGE 11467]|uniref:Uncharacterized protein n=1 Tax=Zarconia navalis LEGE 11467 TaxID=1828826 RepID=A0A928VYX4_9CYAN|nr:hypothetical protein [Zarconia navalis]MBE9040846.1 hypothetical protein [Zarconia navalis LEGE 11467]